MSDDLRNVTNMPWEEKPAGWHRPLWRFSGNPVIGRNPIKKAYGIYNSAVIAFEGGFVGVFRADYHAGNPRLHFGRSPDGINWNIDEEPIEFVTQLQDGLESEYAYDPRICKVEDTYYITWCNGYHGPTIGVASTKDFKTFERLENAFLPYNRNGVLFPEKFNGNFAMLSRPSDTGHTPFGDIFYSESPDMEFWGRHRHVMSKGINWWQGTKIGAGPVPIKLEDGWLMFYHGVMSTCNGFIYRVGAAILDLEKPWIVKYRCRDALIGPEEPYETTGYVPNVLFPVCALTDFSNDRVAVYCGAADTFTTLVFGHISELVAYIKENSQLS